MNDVVILQKKLNMMRSTIANDVSTIVGTDMLKLVDKSFETATAQTNMGNGRIGTLLVVRKTLNTLYFNGRVN